MAWTDERIQLLTQYWDEGRSASQIAELLGEGLTRNAVIGKAHRLGLSSRPSPLKLAEGKPAADGEAKAPRAPRARAARPALDADTAPADAPLGEAATVIDGDPLVEPEAAPATPVPAAPVRVAPVAPAPAAVSAPVAASAPAPAPRPVMPPPARSAKGGKVTLLDLNDRICRWPIGHPDEPDFHFCGRPVSPGFPYCGDHCLLAYQAQMPRKDRPAGPPRPFGPNLPRPR